VRTAARDNTAQTTGTYVTGSTGRVTVPHTLGVVPTHASVSTWNAHYLSVESVTATNAVVIVRRIPDIGAGAWPVAPSGISAPLTLTVST
jgi:hypothetical protein